ncbi:site-specific integrase [Streptomyces sp. NBC_01618]|uniref:site-specific integrase n=1 Tax=Streptomyces sp. NBC_01618 TaxID=2975900 RepID=UPI00386B1F93|nr:site-specific integrase [Streptomyces sp. NBC_01618]
MLARSCEEIAESAPAFAGTKFTPHDFRRLFATEIVNGGLPIHIGAALLGHLNLQTTQGYVAVFAEDIVKHYQEFLNHRRDLRPEHEYGDVTPEEWAEFEEHFDKRKVELGNCARPYGSPCQHEHVPLTELGWTRPGLVLRSTHSDRKVVVAAAGARCNCACRGGSGLIACRRARTPRGGMDARAQQDGPGCGGVDGGAGRPCREER